MGQRKTIWCIMFELFLLIVMVLLVGVGLLVNVYLYRCHAIGTVRRSVTLDEQLFTYYVDASEAW